METTLPAPPRRRMFQAGPVWATLFLGLGAGGLTLVARTAVRDKPVGPALDEVARMAREYEGAAPVGALDEVLAHPEIIPSHHHPLVGSPAPDFELVDSDGRVRNLADLRGGGPVVLIFYYGYYCDHCVRQLFDVNRDLPLFREVGARVVAVSADAPELTRQRFAEHGRFGFPVLSDPGSRVAHAYQVFRGDLIRHGTFVIDRHGIVQWVNVGDGPFRRNPALLYQLATLEGQLPSATVRARGQRP